MSTRRILHVSQPVTEGVARVLADLALFQLAQGWEVHVACPPGWLGEHLGAQGIVVHPWQASRAPGPSSVREARRLHELVARVHPDVVHLHSSKAGLAGRLALRGRVTTVFQPHAWSFHATGGVVGRLSAVWERLAVRWTDLVVAVSGGELHEGYRHGVQPRRTVVAPNGIDVHRFLPQEQHVARARLGLHEDAPIAVCVGRLARQKGQDLLLRAWEGVVREVPEARLLLVGDGPDRAELAGRLGPGVELAGGTDVPEDYYAAADVVVVPSRWEGMALVPLEAMSCERSVVGFDVAGLAESVGDAGAVVPMADVDALTRELVRRLADRDLARREGARGRARAVTLFDRATAVAITDDAIRSLMVELRRPGATD